MKIISDIVDAILPYRTISRLKADNQRLRERLEITHVYKMSKITGQLEREEVPLEEQDAMYDGIDCRDATIELMQRYINKLEKKLGIKHKK